MERGRKRFSGKPVSWSKRRQIYWILLTRFSWKDSHYKVRLVPELDTSFLRLLGYNLVSEVKGKVIAAPEVSECLS